MTRENQEVQKGDTEDMDREVSEPEIREDEQALSTKKKRKKRRRTKEQDMLRESGCGWSSSTGTDGHDRQIIPLDRSSILENRMTAEEIQKIPKFSCYKPGTPSRVLYLPCHSFLPHSILPFFNLTLTPCLDKQTLYIKNLSQDVTTEDLVRIFLGFQKPVAELHRREDYLHFRLMHGRMHGQAFIRFPTAESAAAALDSVHGFVFKGRPLIIQFGKKVEES